MKKLGFIVMPLIAVSLLANCGGSKPQVVEHFVTFESYGGGHFPTQRVKDGETATQPEKTPTRGDDTFLGWFTDFDKPAYTFKEKVNEDITLYAGWEVAPGPVSSYNFKFTGVNCSINGYKTEPFVITLPKGTQTQFQIDPEDGYLLPTQDDQHFKVIKGSIDEYDAATGLIKIGNMTGDIEIEAKSELAPVESYTVTFLNETGGEVKKISDIEAGSKINASDVPTVPTKSGYTPIGWCTDTESKNVFDFETVKIYQNYTLYPGYTKNPDPDVFTVSFDANGGEVTSTNPVTVTEGGRILTAPTLADRPGYDKTAVTWYKESALTNKFEFGESGTPVTSNMVLYAKWGEITKYTVHFKSALDESAVSVDQTIEYNHVVQRPADPTPQEGYTFTNWYDKKTGGDIYTFDKALTGDTKEITIYAQFALKECKITYITNGGTLGTTHVDKVKYGETIATKPDISRSGYDASQVTWWLDQEMTAKKFTFGADGTKVEGDINLFAKWVEPTPTTFTVTFDPNGGALDRETGAKETITNISYGDEWGSITGIDKQTATKDGNFTFAGWGLSPNTPDVIGDEYTITKDFTVYAVYTPYATASIKLSNDSNNCYLYYKGAHYNAGSTFDIPAGTNVTMTVETDEGYLPVFKEKLSFTGGYTTKFNSIKHEVTVNINASSTCTIKATTTTPEEKGTLENYSWSEISQLSEMGLANIYFNVGDTKTVTVNTKIHTVRIIDFNHDKDPEGNNLGITFEFANLITTSNGDAVTTIWDGIYDISGDNCDYRGSVLNDFLNDENDDSSVINMLPSDPVNIDLREVIKPVDKKVGVNETERTGEKYYVATGFDGVTHPYPYLFPLACDEIGGYAAYVTKDEGTKYQYYKDYSSQGDRIKRRAGETTGDGEYYWLRSPATFGSGPAWSVSYSGLLVTNVVYTNTCAVAPAFCI